MFNSLYQGKLRQYKTKNYRTALDLFFGTITYAVDNACLKEAIDMQIHNSTRVPVGPPRAQLASIIYPIPKWDERVYKPVWLGKNQTCIAFRLFCRQSCRNRYYCFDCHCHVICRQFNDSSHLFA